MIFKKQHTGRPVKHALWICLGFLGISMVGANAADIIADNSEVDVYRVGSKLSEVKVVKRDAGSQTLKCGEIHLTQPLKGETPFLLAGPKLYEYGAMDGTFPAVGRLEGDQGGVWCHPIKPQNKFEFEIQEEGQRPWRLQGPSQFVHEFSASKFNFNRNDLKITRQDFIQRSRHYFHSSLCKTRLTSRENSTCSFRGR